MKMKILISLPDCKCDSYILLLLHTQQKKKLARPSKNQRSSSDVRLSKPCTKSKITAKEFLVHFFCATTQGKTKRLYIYIRVSSVMEFFATVGYN